VIDIALCFCKNELQVGPDMLISGFLQPLPDVTPVIPSVDETFAIDPTVTPHESSIIFFYKTWDPYGAFSNFSPHPIEMPDENGDYATWLSVEHYYQVQVLPFLHNLFLQQL
jgi:diaminohydroxyphosphoribosylaminopyrimidine deaminase/5-amino-6-(5-phosphoribosylamino)uracil reductase